jgi:hypothetical protein
VLAVGAQSVLASQQLERVLQRAQQQVLTASPQQVLRPAQLPVLCALQQPVQCAALLQEVPASILPCAAVQGVLQSAESLVQREMAEYSEYSLAVEEYWAAQLEYLVEE